ncbi:MAG TPA: nitroreductase family protein [Atribacterota bacterium]|nr:nitroreductase family protein [Atribacterota bacterium]
MKFQELVKKRYSVRAYKPDDVPQEVIDNILEAARMAPTAVNSQSFKLFVIKTAGFRDELKKVYQREWFSQAPYVIGICGIPEENWVRKDGKNYVDVDSAIVMDHVILAATDLGLGTCWIGAFDPDAVKKFLDLPSGMEPIAFTPIGYPADSPGIKRRKAIDELVHYIK